MFVIYMSGFGLFTPPATSAALNKRPNERNVERTDKDFNAPSDKGKTFDKQKLFEYGETCEDPENEEGCQRKALIIAREILDHFGFHGVAAKIGAIKEKMDEKEKTDGGKTRHRKARNKKRTIKNKKRMKK